ncbi:MAG: glutamate racemase [Aquificaceae bacterium]
MKIGVFDSGVGGLTVLSELRKLYPLADLVYLGDTARVPYGNRSKETIVRYSLECASFFQRSNLDLLVVACNSASACALNDLRKALAIPVVGVIEPGVKMALQMGREGPIGIIGTRATISSGLYRELLSSAGKRVLEKPCPLFVPLVEEGIFSGPLAKAVVEMYLNDLKISGVKTLILGCTHYPMLKATIQEFFGPEVAVIDSAFATAFYVKEYIKPGGSSNLEVFFTDIPEHLEKIVSSILQIPVEIKKALCDSRS